MAKPGTRIEISEDYDLINLYRQLLTPRLIEEKMLSLLRQGRISKWFSGIGQEAISIGATAALEPDEYIFTLHRNLGVFTARDVPLTRLFAQWQGKSDGFTKGRDRSFHFGAPEYHIIGMISHLGPQLAYATGVALGHRLRQEKRVALAFTGEGGTSEGDFHEALNVASVWKLPVIFLIENNAYGLSTPIREQYACRQLSDRGIGYGMEALTIDGNNILEVYQTVRKYAEWLREDPRPVMIECMSFRMRGHEEASGTRYIPEELFEEWAQKDPINLAEGRLREEGLITTDQIASIKSQVKEEIDVAIKSVFDQPEIVASTETEKRAVYAAFQQDSSDFTTKAETTSMRLVDAIKDGLEIAMEEFPDLVLMGQDIAEYGGVFKVTEGFLEKFGRERVRNTPLCESAILGAALGLSLKGFKSMVEMQFADFVSCGFNQIVNNMAKLHYRWQGPADIVVRLPTGAGMGAGPFHSQSNEAWFYHTPGLKIFYPSNPRDAKGLLLAAFKDPNPVLFFEHKGLYRKITGSVPSGYYETEIGKANIVRPGADASIITYGQGVHWALEVAEEIDGDLEIVDLRTLVPLDYESLRRTVQKTHRVLVLHEDTLTGGIGGDISAYISEHLFEHLDAPVIRVASLDTPVPFAATLEANFLPVKRLKKKLERLLNY